VTSAVDGLVSGLSTSSLINQLMTVEAAPQTRLKAKVSTAQTTSASYQSVNSRVSALKSAADTLGQLSTWRGIKAASTSSTVTATALVGTNGSAGTTTFDVKTLAKSQISTAKVATSGDVTGASSIDVTVGPLDGSYDADGKPRDKKVTIALTDRSAKGIADAINAAGLGVKAAVVTTGGANNILQFSGTKTGTNNAFKIEGMDDLPLNDVATVSNAVLTIGGGEGNGGYDAISDTNTFSKLMPGVSITVSKVESDVTVTASQDVSGIADKFQALVDAANATLSEISNQTAYNASTKKGSPLTGDFAVRNMAQTIMSSVSQGLVYDDPTWVKPDNDPDAKAPRIKFGSLAQFGIQLDSTGQLKFDATKFAASYNANPSGIQQAGIALGDQFEAMATTMNTNVTSVITGRNKEIDSLNTQIDNWDIRLAAKRTALQKQYSDLEVALGKLKDQSNWLSGQLAGLG
jgi:flagellar hook-associated protein 2